MHDVAGRSRYAGQGRNRCVHQQAQIPDDSLVEYHVIADGRRVVETTVLTRCMRRKRAHTFPEALPLGTSVPQPRTDLVSHIIS